MTRDTPGLPRRALLRTLSLVPLALAVPVRAAPARAAADLIAAEVCRLTPELAEGPFYLDPHLVRSDITESRPGVPLHLQLQVVTAACRPVQGARVDVWHCDAEGTYSGYARQGSDQATDTAGRTFLRGTQFSRADGVAGFRSIYPGWYAGRATHIHFKVFAGGRAMLTSQLFLPDALNARIYRSVAPYDRRDAGRAMPNARDRIAVEGGAAAVATVRRAPDGYAAALVVGLPADALL